jgi:hypothetical protein
MTDYDDAPGAADQDNTEASEAPPGPARDADDGRDVDPMEPPDGTNVGA